MTYAKQTWYDTPSTASPLSGVRLNYMEQGISDADVTTAGSPAAVALAAAVANGVAAANLATQAVPSAPAAGWTISLDFCTKVGRIVILDFIATKSSAWINGDTILTLPAGFRPTYTVRFGGWSGVGGATGACALDIGQTGTVLVYGVPGGNTQVGFSVTYLAP